MLKCFNYKCGFNEERQASIFDSQLLLICKIEIEIQFLINTTLFSVLYVLNPLSSLWIIPQTSTKEAGENKIFLV